MNAPGIALTPVGDPVLLAALEAVLGEHARAPAVVHVAGDAIQNQHKVQLRGTQAAEVHVPLSALMLPYPPKSRSFI